VQVRRAEAADRDGWEPLFVGYNRFYGRELEPDRIDRAWSAILDERRIEALVAETDSGLVGLAHFFRHPSSTSADVCYLQDLFTDEAARRRRLGTRRGLCPRLLAHPGEQRDRPPPLRPGRGEPRFHQVRPRPLNAREVASFRHDFSQDPA
jgi:GNAT superfamily N-acetyltransferase